MCIGNKKERTVSERSLTSIEMCMARELEMKLNQAGGTSDLEVGNFEVCV